MRWLKSFVIGVALTTFFCIPTAFSNPNEEEHKELQKLHPCGDAGLDFNGLTGFFRYRWDATYRDLTDHAVKIWLEYHNLENSEIVVVRLFRSKMQETIGVLHGRRFINYMDREKTQPLVNVLCIVKVNNSHVIQYTMDEIQAILNSGGEDT